MLFSRTRRRYKRYRALHPYSRRFLFFIFDTSLGALKIALVCLPLFIVYKALTWKPGKQPQSLQEITESTIKADSVETELLSGSPLTPTPPLEVANPVIPALDTAPDTTQSVSIERPSVIVLAEKQPQSVQEITASTIKADNVVTELLSDAPLTPTPPLDVANPVIPVLDTAIDTTQRGSVDSPSVIVLAEDWILAQRRRSYTLQLATSLTKEKLLEIANEQTTDSQVYIYPFIATKLSTPVYGLAVGLYPNLETAKQALETYRQFDPWVRSIGELQNEIDRVRELQKTQ